MKDLLHTTLALTTMITLVACLFVVNHQTHCAIPSENNLLLGNACTAEALSNPTIWTLNETNGTLPSEKFQIIIAFVVLFFTRHLFSQIKRPERGLSWLQRRKITIRSGPAPNQLFLPYLFATHGW
ncbi:hypothetical protein HQ487_03510 [Candidatus Uhrbacteria bacterium]|nr:hypothetical protein [Candidatus Uhrbacteria bacterium]